ncbi:hypothetical protein [Leptospira interrogans]|uniref:hypothetical protein n=1 Tax=Leptospira interrogans TaxID=173 RepID=UPI00077320A9|nr:hypothetical protein [Leptospira interrogans]
MTIPYSVKRSNLNEFIFWSNSENWPKRSIEDVENTWNYWKNLGALSLGLFLTERKSRNREYIIDCYAPRVKSVNEIGVLDTELVKDIVKDKRFLNFLSGSIPVDDEMFIIPARRKKAWYGELIIELYEEEVVESMVSKDEISKKWKSLQNARQFLMEMAPIYEKHPSLKAATLSQTVQAIEQIQRDIDELSGYSLQQQESHSIVVKVPTPPEMKGKLSAPIFSRLVSKFQSIIDSMDDGVVSGNLNFYVVGIVPSSAVLLADFETSKDHDSKEFGKLLEERLRSSLSQVDLIKSESSEDVPEKATSFTTSLNVDNAAAYRIVSAIQDLTPTPGDNVDFIEITMPFQNLQLRFDSNDRKKLSKVKSYLSKYKQNSEGATKIVRGELGAAFEWKASKIHKFTIKPDGEKRITVNYEANSKDDEHVNNSMTSTVKVRVKYEKGKWFLKDWLAG